MAGNRRKIKMNSRQHWVYDIGISSMAVASVALILMDFTKGLNGWQLWLNRGLFLVFVVDICLRYGKAADKRRFLSINYFDLLAVIPFHGIFPDVPLRTVNVMLRVLNLSRIVAFLCRPLKKAHRFFNTNGFKYMIFVTVILILSGGVLIHYAEGMTIEDGIWWSFVTATTVGYGDISPSTVYGRLIAMVLMMLGIGLIGSVTSTLTSFFLRRQTTTVKDQVISLVQEELQHFDELSEEDVEEICRLLRTEKAAQKAAAQKRGLPHNTR